MCHGPRLRTAAAAALLFAAGCTDPAPSPVEAALSRAEAALAAGRYGAARKELGAFGDDALRTPADRRRLAVAALRCKDPARAARVLAKDASGPPAETAEARLLRAEGLLRSGDTATAERELRDLERAHAGGERRVVLHAMALAVRGHPDDAGPLLEPVVGGGSRDPEAHVFFAQAASGSRPEMERRLVHALGVVEDPAPVHRALGRFHLMPPSPEPARAADALERAVAARPWDRDARLDLARACLMVPDGSRLRRAVEAARAMVEEVPGDAEARLALAESLGESARRQGPAGAAAMKEALAQYEALRSLPVPGAALRVRLLQGLARAHMELLLEDAHPGLPGSHFRAAIEALDQADALDPKREFRGPWGAPLAAETMFLRGRAMRRARVKDDTDAKGYYEKAVDMDPGHLEATWDLAMIYYDWMRTHEWQVKALALFRQHVEVRRHRGLPPLGPEDIRFVRHCERLVKDGQDFRPGDTTPDVERR